MVGQLGCDLTDDGTRRTLIMAEGGLENGTETVESGRSYVFTIRVRNTQ